MIWFKLKTRQDVLRKIKIKRKVMLVDFSSRDLWERVRIQNQEQIGTIILTFKNRASYI